MDSSVCSGKKDIILFFPDPKLEGLSWHRMPFAVLAISGLLVEQGYRVRIFDERFERDLERDIAAALSGAVCVGISCFTGNQISGALRVAKLVRDNAPGLPIVWGGWHPSIFPEQTAKDANVDIVVYGQGERTFVELINAFVNNKPLKDIPGLCYRSDGVIVKTSPRALEDINNFPVMPLSLINIRNYIGPHPGFDNAMTLSYISSQGCPHRCGFCADKKVYQRRWFGLKAERVVSEIARLVKDYSLKAIYFEDTNFFVDKKRIADICSGIIANKIDIKWEAMGHPRHLVKMEDSLWDLVRESGCRRILIGAESGDQEILDLINKDATVQDTVDFVKKAKKHNIAPILSTIVGFPKSAWKDLFKTIKLAVDIKRLNSSAEWKLFIYTPYPGTDLYEMAIKAGMKEPQDLAGWSKHTLRDVDTPWINDKFRKRIRHIAFFYVQVAYPSKYVRERLGNSRCNVLILNVFKIAQLVAKIRIKFNFYAFPVEPWLYGFLRGRL